jgi:hypothetical protein
LWDQLPGVARETAFLDGHLAKRSENSHHHLHMSFMLNNICAKVSASRLLPSGVI